MALTNGFINIKFALFYVMHALSTKKLQFIIFFIIFPYASHQNQLMNQNSLIFKCIVKILEVLVKQQKNQQRKLLCGDVLQKFIESKNILRINELDMQNRLKFVQIHGTMVLFRKAFLKTTSKNQYKNHEISHYTISQFIFSIQQNIDLMNFKTSYLRQIIIRKNQFNWSKDFIQDWFKAFDQQKQNQKQQAENRKQKKKEQKEEQKEDKKENKKEKPEPMIAEIKPQKKVEIRHLQMKMDQFLEKKKGEQIKNQKILIEEEKEQKVGDVNGEGMKGIEKRKRIKKVFKSKKELLRQVVELDSNLEEYVLEFNQMEQEGEKKEKEEKGRRGQKERKR